MQIVNSCSRREQQHTDIPRWKKAVQEHVSRVRSSEKSGRGKDQDRTVIMRATTLRGTPALSATDSRSTQRQRNSTISSTSHKLLACREASPIILLGNVRVNHLQITKPPDDNASVLPPRMTQPDTSESELDMNQENQNLLTQADIPRIVKAVMSNLSVHDTSSPPQDPPQGASDLDLRHVTIFSLETTVAVFPPETPLLLITNHPSDQARHQKS